MTTTQEKDELSKKVKELFTDYLINNHEDEILEILQARDEALTYPIYVDCGELISEVVEISFKFFVDSVFYLELLQASAVGAQKIVIENCLDEDLILKIKKNVVVRLHSLPDAEEIEIKLPNIKHTNKFISFSGTVTKAFTAKMLESTQIYNCNKCGMEFSVGIDYGNEDIMVKPAQCAKNGCESTYFTLVKSEKNLKHILKDYQEIKVQEKLDVFSVGTVPRSIIVILEDDLVDSCKPGDDVTINGIVIERWGRLSIEMRANIELIIHANFIIVNNDEQTHVTITKEKEKQFRDFWEEYKNRPITARNIILTSLSPQLYGMYIVKLAVMLVLTGGVSRSDSSGTRVRGESHLLLVGDPGTGKSQFLKFAQKMIPRSVMTTGIGSTSAGLTATASRDGGQWHLEAGALVLADGGICCVDEFNCMKEHDRLSMLEAMEQQTISVAKAGIVCKLKTECSVLAACNPKGSYDSSQPLTVNIALSSPLLSRFDVVLLLLDSPNKDWDTLASTFLLQGKDLLKRNKEDIWNLEKLRLYINYVKTLEPTLTPKANRVIQSYYSFQRQSDDRNAARTTVRMLESVIRLSQAHAKLMLRNEVLVMDAVVSITLIECSLNKSASFGNVNILHTSFPNNAELEYKNQVEMVLKRLSLEDMLIEELDQINQNYVLVDESTSSESTQQNTNSFDVMSQLINKIPTQNSTINFTSQRQQQYSQDSFQKENQNEYSILNDTNSCVMSTVTDKKTSRKRKVDTSALLELHSQFQNEVNSKRKKSEEFSQSLNSSKLAVDQSQASRMNMTSNFNDDDLDLDI